MHWAVGCNISELLLREDPRNILGVIIAMNENDLYTIATRHGILSNKYTRADFTLPSTVAEGQWH